MRPSRSAEHAVLALGLSAVAFTFRDYGVTWDEWLQSRYGELVVAYFASGLRDTRHESLEDLRYYGPLFEALCAIVYQAAPAWKAEIRHLLSAATGLLAVYGVMRFSRLFGRPLLPLLAGLALLAWPRFYGHSFINSKDVPFACAVTWAMYLLARYHLRGRRGRDALLAGLALGAALAIRPGGMLLFGFVVGAGLLDFIRRSGRRAALATAWPLLKLLGMLAVAWAVMVASWPWAHAQPIERPLLALELATRFPAKLPLLFEGSYQLPDALPWYYVPKYLLITIPLVHIPFLLVGMGAALAMRGTPHYPLGSDRAFLARLALLWFAAPIAAAAVLRPPLYDEIRHFLFVLPAAAVLVGLGAETVMDSLRPRLGRAVLALPLLLLLSLPDLVRLHPYQYTYFNTLAGGVGEASHFYETDYWLSSYKEAMEWLNAQPAIPGRKRRLAVAANDSSRYCVEYYARPGFEIKTVAEAQGDPGWRYDDFLGTTRLRMTEYATTPIVRLIGREGAVFSVVKQR